MLHISGENMARTFDLLHENPKKLFARYLLPSVSATFVTSIYIIADTIMIGRGVGAEALVALNLVLPMFSLLFAFGMLFGVGGGVLMSVANGADDKTRAHGAFSTALAAAVIFALSATVLCSVFLRPICFLLGADESNITLVMDYAVYVAHFAPAFVFSTFLQALVRNDHDPHRAMVGVLAGAATNIVLDYIFIFEFGMGMRGGAIATVIGNILTVLILLTHFLSPHNSMRFNRSLVKSRTLARVVTTGAPSFLIESAAGIVTFSFNRQLLRYMGVASVVIYGIIANCAIVCMSIFNGISQAALPVLAANFGAKKHARVLTVRRCGLLSVLVIGVLFMSTAWWMPGTLISLFVEPTAQMFADGIPVLRLYFIAFLPMGVNLFCSTYFQSIVSSLPALCIALMRGIVLPITLVLALPAVLGGSAIWMVVPIAETITVVVSLILLRTLSLDRKIEVKQV